MLSILKSLFGSNTKSCQVQLNPQGAIFETAPGQTLLEAALSRGIAYPHNCTVGTCGSCKTRLIQGKVHALSDFGYTLSKHELDNGYILACQAVPREENVVLELPASACELRPPEAYEAQIMSTEALTHDIVKMVVKTDRPVTYVAGQYASFMAEGMHRARNYSFVDAPLRTGRCTLSFFVRKVPGGEFTESLFNGELEGKTLSLVAAHGDFHLRTGDGPIICIAGGSGLAPLLSVLEDMRMRRIRRPCVLYFGARTQADLYGLESIQRFREAWGMDFWFVPVLSNEPEQSGWTGARGLVTDALSTAIDGQLCSGEQAYLCGPPAMIDAAIDRLVEMGLGLDDIFYDKFTDGLPATEAAPLLATT